MAATPAVEQLFQRYKIWTAEWDPTGGTTDPEVLDLGQPQAAGLKFIPIARLKRFAAILSKTVGTGNTDEFSIVAATNAAGTGSPTVVVQIVTATAITQNAINDNLVLECTVAQIHEVLATATHVGVRAEAATGTDEWVCTAIAEYMDARDGLTANYIA
jgi:hypothetical protein